MNSYIIVGLIEGELEERHQKLAREIRDRFSTPYMLSGKLPTHITFKEQFSMPDTHLLRETLSRFCATHAPLRVEYRGYDHFGTEVVFMDARLAPAAFRSYADLLHSLKLVPGLDWQPHDGEGRHFHSTLACHDIAQRFDDIWDFLKNQTLKADVVIERIALLSTVTRPWSIDQTWRLIG